MSQESRIGDVVKTWVLFKKKWDKIRRKQEFWVFEAQVGRVPCPSVGTLKAAVPKACLGLVLKNVSFHLLEKQDAWRCLSTTLC